MVGNDQLATAKGVYTAAKSGERLTLPQQIGRRGGAKRDDDFRPHHVNLAEEEWRTGICFFGLRGAVLRRTAFDHIGDIDFFAFEAHGRNHVVEQLAGATYKRQSLRIFIRTWSFAYKQQSRVGIAVGEDNLVAALVECAAGAVADFFANEIKRGCAVGGANFCGNGGGVEKACGAEWGGLLWCSG